MKKSLPGVGEQENLLPHQILSCLWNGALDQG